MDNLITSQQETNKVNYNSAILTAHAMIKTIEDFMTVQM